MIIFKNNCSTSFKIKNKIAIGYIRQDKIIEIWYRGIKCELPININTIKYEIKDELEFIKNVLIIYKTNVKSIKNK